jgi:hypothetical protein
MQDRIGIVPLIELMDIYLDFLSIIDMFARRWMFYDFFVNFMRRECQLIRVNRRRHCR